eukprot:m.111091 g.111091  ORF g.111091 m.111091 type:complete len:549 (+) comp21356_c0_seq4:136-1782(+)
MSGLSGDSGVNRPTSTMTSTAIPALVVREGRPTKTVLELHDVFWGGVVQPDRIVQHFKKEGRLAPDAAAKIVHDCTALLRTEPTLLTLDGPVTVVGDIHGQFFDLLRVFKLGGDPATSRYLFLGDYVDRGYFSMECLLYLWALKLRYPRNIYLLRGNHESRHLTQYFTFETECVSKYSRWLYDECMRSFDSLPLAAVLDTQFLCVHGGLSPDITTLADIASIDRFMEPPTTGAMSDMLWADPLPDFGEHEKGASLQPFTENVARGCSYYFSYAATCQFLERNNLLCLVRAHEAQDAGYRMYDTTPASGFPSMICVFSAPNYLDVGKNKGAVLRLGGGALKVKQFTHAPHPYWLPNFMNVFMWSLPFVGKSVTEILEAVVTPVPTAAVCDDPGSCSRKKGADLCHLLAPPSDRTGSQPTPSQRRGVIRQKIRAVGRLSFLLRLLRTESEAIVALKQRYRARRVSRCADACMPPLSRHRLSTHLAPCRNFARTPCACRISQLHPRYMLCKGSSVFHPPPILTLCNLSFSLAMRRSYRPEHCSPTRDRSKR